MGGEDSVGASRLKLHTAFDLFDLAETEWLVEGILPVESFAVFYGPSGQAKTFVTVDLAMSVSTGSSWLGHATKEGAVVYIVAEGGRGVSKRVRAWLDHHGWPKEPAAFFLLDAVQITDRNALRALAKRIADLGVEVILIVVDTLARCFGGGDENSSQDMSEFVAGIDWLKKEIGAAMITVHHSGKPKPTEPSETERGSSALRAAADVMVHVSMDKDRIVTVKNNKQKDAEEFPPMKLRLKQVPILSGADQTTSCVLTLEGHVPTRAQTLPMHLKTTLQALASCPNGEASVGEWQTKAGAKGRTIHSHRDALVKLGHIEARQPKGRYAITEKGRLALGGTAATATTPTHSNGSSATTQTAATATTPIGVADAAEAAVDDWDDGAWAALDAIRAAEEEQYERMMRSGGSHE